MANTLKTVDGHSVVPIILANKMYFQAQHLMGWGQFVGKGSYTTPEGKPVAPNGAIKAGEVSNAPVVIHRELVQKQGVELRVPTLRNLVNRPKVGSETLKGFGEKQKMNFANILVDVYRHAVELQNGPIGEQVTKEFQLQSKANGQLLRSYAEVVNYLQIAHAAYFGYDWAVLNSDTYAGSTNISVSARSHPHIYTVGGGKVSGYPPSASYETAVATAIDNVGTNHVLTAGWLRELASEDQIRRIRPLYTADGMPYKILGLHPYQIKALRNDADMKAIYNQAFTNQLASKNPYLSNCVFFAEGFAIFDMGNSVWPAWTASGVPLFGPSTINDPDTLSMDDFNSFADADLYTKFTGVVLGDNAILKASASAMTFTTEVDDHEFWKELGYTIVEGASRNDSINRDDGTAGQYLVNDGSAIIISYGSPASL